MAFSSLGVNRSVAEALASMDIKEPTPIQKACIPEILAGRNCIGGAQTGSGKTIAFAAPMLTQWAKDPYGVCGLVLTPTRELAMQIAEQILALGATLNIRVCLVVGGVDMTTQALELKTRPHFVVATPGRLADHIKSSGEDTVKGLRRAGFLVLDEADRLLSDSFGDDLAQCMDIVPAANKRQTLLFTATVTDAVRMLKDKVQGVFLHDLTENTTNGSAAGAVPSTLTQQYLFGPSYVREAYLYGLVAHPDNEEKSIIVFVNRTRTAELVRRMLQLLGVRTTSLHSEMPQSERINGLGRFRAGAARVLVATDVASRGLDIPMVEMVVNFDLPADADDYVHRVGRTARAGRSGQSVSFVTELDVERVQNIEARVGSKMVEYEGMSDEDIIKTYLKDASTAKRQAGLDMDREGFGVRRRKEKERSARDKPAKKQRTDAKD